MTGLETTPPAVRTRLSVVVPACNSGELITETLSALAKRLSGHNAEIIVVENGSTDDTRERCHELASRWPESTVLLRVLHSDRGLGNALRTGVLASVGELVLLTADDLPFGFDDLDAAERLAAELGEHPPLVIGSKAHRDSIVSRGRVRGVLTWGFKVIRHWILGMRAGDPQGTLIVRGDLV